LQKKKKTALRVGQANSFPEERLKTSQLLFRSLVIDGVQKDCAVLTFLSPYALSWIPKSAEYPGILGGGGGQVDSRRKKKRIQYNDLFFSAKTSTTVVYPLERYPPPPDPEKVLSRNPERIQRSRKGLKVMLYPARPELDL
jgi:hypothetical protein